MYRLALLSLLLLVSVSGLRLPAVDLDGLDGTLPTADEDGDADAKGDADVDPELMRNLGLVWDYDKGEAYFIDDLGKVMAGPFEDAYPFYDGLGLANTGDGIYRLYNGKGQVEIKPPEWGFFRSVFRGGLVVVEGKGGMHYFNRKGEQVFTGFQKALPFEGGFAMVVKDGQPGVINREGRKILNGRPFEHHFGDEVAAVRMNAGGAWYFVDQDGQRVCGSTYQDAGAFSQGWAPVLYDPQEGEWAFVDTYGDLLDKRDRYHQARAFGDGVAPVKNKRDKWALIDLGGKRVCGYKYDELQEMHEGRAAFRDDGTGLWGFIDREGKVVIDARFGGVFPFTNGLSLVSEGDEDIYINRQGERVWPKK